MSASLGSPGLPPLPLHLAFIVVQNDAAVLCKLSRAARLAQHAHGRIPDVGGGPSLQARAFDV